MAYRFKVALSCDVPGCPRQTQLGLGGAQRPGATAVFTEDTVEAQVRQAGWLLLRTSPVMHLLLCPKHRAVHEAPTDGGAHGN